MYAVLMKISSVTIDGFSPILPWITNDVTISDGTNTLVTP